MSSESGPYLQLAAFCERVIESKQGVLSLINVVDRMTISSADPEAPEQMPERDIDWCLVLSFRSGEARGTYQVRIIPEKPSGIKLDPFEVPAHFEGGNRGPQLVLQMQFRVTEPGLYWFWIYLGEDFLTKIPLEVIYGRTRLAQRRLGQ